VAEVVGNPPTEQQEAAEHQDVGVNDPGQVLRGDAEVATDRGRATLTIEASRTSTNWVAASRESATVFGGIRIEAPFNTVA
jgi:hypothetical protein